MELHRRFQRRSALPPRSRARKSIVECVTWFGRSEKGLVAVEWVALTAGVVIGAIIIGVIVMDGLVAPATEIGNQLTIN